MLTEAPSRKEKNNGSLLLSTFSLKCAPLSDSLGNKEKKL